MKGGKYYGTKAMMNVWKPRIQVPEFEMSLAQFWIGAGSFGVDLNSLEAGWQVFLYCNLAHYLTGFFLTCSCKLNKHYSVRYAHKYNNKYHIQHANIFSIL